MRRFDPRTPGAEPIRIAEGREAEIFAWGADLVLRLYRDPNASGRADREIAALEAVRSAMPRVPAPHGRMDWKGRPGILMQRLDGRAVLAEIQRRPWRVWTLAKLCGRVHAELNRVEAPRELPELRDELRRRIEGEPLVPPELRAAAFRELDRVPDGNALCHGDFQPDNVLMCAAGPVVIDWSYATRGDPCGDFARTALMMKLGSVPPGTPWLIRFGQLFGRGFFACAYVAGYQETLRHPDEAVARWKLVRAVERIADRIPEERSALLRFADALRRVLQG